MPYEFEVHRQLPVIIITYTKPIDFMNDPLKIVEKIDNLGKDLSDETVFVVHNITDLDISFSDLAFALVSAFKLSHYESDIEGRLRTVAVGASKLAKAAGQLTKQSQYGNRDIYFYDKVEEAFDAIKQILLQEKDDKSNSEIVA